MEDCEILALNFMSPSWFGCFAQSPDYDAYMSRVDPMLPLRYHQRVLKLLQWKNPREHWVLKDVPHLDRMGPLLKIYPDACFIWPHRDPVRALASGISAIGTLQWTGSDHLFKAGSLEWISNPTISAARFDAVIEQLKAGLVPPRQICHVLYRDLVGDTMGTLKAMYRHFDISLSDTGKRGMVQYLADHPRESRPPHKVAMTPEAMAEARAAYKNYQDYFGIPSD
jgi:Sulfotransferase family